MKDARSTLFTETACFKEPPEEICAGAWRILLCVTAGKELIPGHVQKYAKRAFDRLGAGGKERGRKSTRQSPTRCSLAGGGRNPCAAHLS